MFSLQKRASKVMRDLRESTSLYRVVRTTGLKGRYVEGLRGIQTNADSKLNWQNSPGASPVSYTEAAFRHLIASSSKVEGCDE